MELTEDQHQLVVGAQQQQQHFDSRCCCRFRQMLLMHESAAEGIRVARNHAGVVYIFHTCLVVRLESKCDPLVYTEVAKVTQRSLEAWSDRENVPSAYYLCRRGTS